MCQNFATVNSTLTNLARYGRNVTYDLLFFYSTFLSPHNLSLSPNWCLWEPKMCRHAWQRPRHAWQRPRHALQRPRHAFLQGPRSPTSKKNPPTCCLISCEVKGVVYHQVSICVGMLDNS